MEKIPLPCNPCALKADDGQVSNAMPYMTSQTVSTDTTIRRICMRLMRLPDDPPGKPDDWSRPVACRTMEERWTVLRDFSATEYDDVKICPDTILI
ncbi:hypothetical protein GGS24DRAFT_501802 [Hypoxylon argillaceum]|nr:hypothetical protein GGS24DRAFT_501802 [Hypoxylon argillaceum]